MERKDWKLPSRKNKSPGCDWTTARATNPMTFRWWWFKESLLSKGRWLWGREQVWLVLCLLHLCSKLTCSKRSSSTTSCGGAVLHCADDSSIAHRERQVELYMTQRQARQNGSRDEWTCWIGKSQHTKMHEETQLSVLVQIFRCPIQKVPLILMFPHWWTTRGDD